MRQAVLHAELQVWLYRSCFPPDKSQSNVFTATEILKFFEKFSLKFFVAIKATGQKRFS